MDRPQQPVPLVAEPDQGEAQQRGTREVEAAGAVLVREPLEGGRLLLAGEVRQVDVVPGEFHGDRDHLHRVAGLAVAEARLEVGVALQQRGAGRAQRGDVHRHEVGDELQRVDVESVAVVVGKEQQSLLEGRQRQDFTDGGRPFQAGAPHALVRASVADAPRPLLFIFLRKKDSRCREMGYR